jgi:Dihydrodipicolinate synthase/N-acetylneuraminate lyase
LKFEGIIPAFVSPLSEDNTIKEAVTRKLLAYEIAMGADGFYICGATGEGLVMQPEERKKLCEIAVDEIKGKKPIITHIAAMDMKTTIDLAKHAENAGVDCIASVPPFYFVYDDNDIYNYYKELAASVHIPVMIYYHPAAKADMKAELIAQLFEIDNVTAVKWSSGNYFELLKLKQMTNGEMNIINGPDEMLVCGLAAGADGGIGSTYNVMLKEYKAIYHFFQNGQIEKARNMQMKVNRVVSEMIQHKVIPSVKYALELLGFDVGNATFPMKRFTIEEKKQLEAQLHALGWPFQP